MSRRKQPAAAPVPSEPEAYLKLAVNGHMLTGEKRGGKWAFVCEDWPDLAAPIADDDTGERRIAYFMARALGGAVTVKTLAEKV